MLNKLLKLRRMRGDARAVQRGPDAVAKRGARRGLRSLVRRLFR